MPLGCVLEAGMDVNDNRKARHPSRCRAFLKREDALDEVERVACHGGADERERDSASANFAIQQQTRREHLTRCENGISKYL